jgi:hypothetical protein
MFAHLIEWIGGGPNYLFYCISYESTKSRVANAAPRLRRNSGDKSPQLIILVEFPVRSTHKPASALRAHGG